MSIRIFRDTRKPVGFQFKPQYYDPAKEDLDNRVNKYKIKEDAEQDIERNKDNIRNVFRSKQSGTYYRDSTQKSNIESNLRLFKIIAILSIIAVLIIRSDAVLRLVESLSGK
jgi:hypothetical protein